jgi:5-methylcytosine-specific restriction endonuclease McrA
MAYFDDNTIDEVWNKASVVTNNDPDIWRKDFAGAWIRKDHYGKTSDYGWEIDHLKPVSKGGSDDLSNLLPMHWNNNRSKADNYPDFFSAKTSSGVKNIDKQESWKVN